MDILTSIAGRESGPPVQRVIGSGTILDIARFRTLLGAHFRVGPRSVHASAIGEHGDSEIPVWSPATMAGGPLPEFSRLQGRPYDRAALDLFFGDVRDPADDIIETLLVDYQTVLSLSTWMTGQHGIHDISLSLSPVLGAEGIEETLTFPLRDAEADGFRASARTLTHPYHALAPRAD